MREHIKILLPYVTAVSVIVLGYQLIESSNQQRKLTAAQQVAETTDSTSKKTAGDLVTLLNDLGSGKEGSQK
jgi:hypothetical protein